MSMIRLQNKTPSEYCKQSRDFQYLCRLYDSTINGILYDISTIPDILSSRQCRDTILPLLQTKLGFFTNIDINNNSLRYILEVFPILIKYKGSFKAVRYAVNTFLKINNVRSEVTIQYKTEETVLESGVVIPDHTVLVGINSTLQDINILDAIFRYILPAGIGYYFYFYSTISNVDKQLIETNAKLIYTSFNINAQVRGSNQLYSQDESNRLIGAVDTVNIASSDTLIPTENGTFGPGDDSLFMGVFEGDDSFNDFIQSLSETFISGNIIVYNNIEYVYVNSSWTKITFYGNVLELSYAPTITEYMVVFDIDTNSYYIRINDEWVSNNVVLYVYLNYAIGNSNGE